MTMTMSMYKGAHSSPLRRPLALDSARFISRTLAIIERRKRE
jgi:hypothetical protein